MNHVPKEWMPDAKVTRVVCHWSAGAYKASNLGRTHYGVVKLTESGRTEGNSITEWT
jgi:hypothetical protein